MERSQTSSQNNRLTILIVDDDHSALDLINDAFADLGFNLVQAQSANEALIYIKANDSKLALIISDFNMPGETGFDLRKMMLPEFVEIPFIILSGFVSREEALQAIDLKISGFIEKPFQIKALKSLALKESAARVLSLNEDEELRTGFGEEGRALLDEMESIVLSFETHPDDIDSINRLFACAHTIKGTSGYFKPDTINRFTHKFEDFIVRFRGSELSVDAASAAIMLSAIDVIRELLRSLESHSAPRPLEELIPIFDVQPRSAKPLDGSSPKSALKVEIKAEELKVSIALLDSFMERSGELTVLRNMVNKTLRLIETKHAQDTNVAALSILLGEMHKTNVMMQEQMAELRKVPFRHVVKPLSRTVHDLAAQLKKKMKLEIRGEELRIDHAVADVLGKCLIHIVRNSADHGLEKPEDRVAQGKSPTGTIIIHAEQNGENYFVSISDDGRGVNFDRVVSKVIENGLATADELAKMPRSQVLEFIFEPGFSTAAAVTDVSGRGVGTDMVKTTVESVGGHIRISSEAGEGSDFVLSIPVPKSVQIVNSLLVQMREQTFALPQMSVRRVMRVPANDSRIQMMSDRGYFVETGVMLPIVSLAEVLEVPPSLSTPASVENSEHLKIVWVETKSGEFGLAVDSILDVEDTVVKKVANWVSNLKVYAGATFLGDGKAGLVLDLEGIAGKMFGLTKVLERSLRQRSIEPSLVSLSDLQTVQLLTFKMESTTNYAVEQSELFRLEEFATTDFQSVGSTTVALYRGAAMRILTINGESLNSRERANWPVVVIELDESLIGFAVKEIGGFVECERLTLDSGSKLIAVENRTLTLLSLKKVAERVIQAESQGNDEAA